MAAPTQQERVLQGLDIPASASTLQDVVATTAVGGVTNFYMTNKNTFFQDLVIAITGGYASSGHAFSSDEEFAQSACNLARAIAFQAPKYSSQ